MNTPSALITASMILLIGCGNNADNNHGYGYFYDTTGATGLRLRHAPGQPLPTIADIDLIYVQTSQCMGLDPAIYGAPLVVITDDMPKNNDGGKPYGAIYLDTGLILINAVLKDTDDAFWTLKHEFVHYFLHQSGLEKEENVRHRSIFFERCSQRNAV